MGLALGGLMMVQAGCKPAGASDQKQERPPAAVRVAVAHAVDVPVYLDEIGRTVPIQMVEIMPQIGGKLTAVHVEDGAEIEKGAKLFEIDPRPYEAQLQAAKAALQQAQAQRQLAQVEFNRAEDLVRRNATSGLELEQRKADLAGAEARVASAEAAVVTAELNLNYARIVSPLSGRGGAVLVDAGNVVKANDQPLLVIQQLDPIYAEFSVNENDLGTVRKYLLQNGLDLGKSPEKGLKVIVDVPGDSAQMLAAMGSAVPATRPSGQQGARTGELTFLDNAVLAGTGTVRLRATVANADHYFWPGQFVKVRVVLTTKKDAVLIPALAVQVGQNGTYVVVVTPQNTAELRPIRTGQRHGEEIVIEEGLRAGEQVVTIGHLMIQPGGPVMVIQGEGGGPGMMPPGVGQPGQKPGEVEDAKPQEISGPQPAKEKSTP